MNHLQVVYFVNHWPEPQSSAAGLRTYEMSFFLQRLGYQIHGVAPGPSSSFSAQWEATGVQTLSCDPNDSKIEESLKNLNPQVVVYDRFYMEEQFGWRAREIWPQALHMIDTSDLHCIRRARQRALELKQNWSEILHPADELYEEDILREMGSLHRADVCLVVSSFEANWLKGKGFEAERVLLLPFSSSPQETTKSFEERQGFCFLGNYLHAPNLDAVKWLETELWPAVRVQNPELELHLYGAYPPQMVAQLKGKKGIICHGSVEDHRAAISKHIALVAPLRFGAGVKGKVLEAWATGTPVLGTPITFEGIADNYAHFLEAADFVQGVQSLQRKDFWQQSVSEGQRILTKKFDAEELFQTFRNFLSFSFENKERWRSSLTGRMLRHHGAQYLKYFSRWIEEKNKRLSEHS